MDSSLNRLHVLILFLLGASLFLTNPWFTEVDDECAIIDAAARPISQTVRLYVTGVGEHEHPPLYDLILHGWLKLTRGERHLLRLPAILFYLTGAWILASAVKRQAGSAAQNYALVLIAFSPFGFHFGRLATWYSFCFLLVGFVTQSYFRYLESPRFANWASRSRCSVPRLLQSALPRPYRSRQFPEYRKGLSRNLRCSSYPRKWSLR